MSLSCAWRGCGRDGAECGEVGVCRSCSASISGGAQISGVLRKAFLSAKNGRILTVGRAGRQKRAAISSILIRLYTLDIDGVAGAGRSLRRPWWAKG